MESPLLTAEEVQRAFHYLYPAEVPALRELTRMLPPNPVIVNIGSGSGTSGLTFLTTRDDVTLVTVDIQDESSPFGCLEAERDVVERAGLRHLLGNRWFQIHGDSKAVGRNYATSQLPLPDMVFIDGDHSYEGAKGDIGIWVPLIRAGGIVAVHDYLKSGLQADPNGPHPMPWPGVDSAVNEMLIPNLEMILHVASLVAFRIPKQ